MTAKSSDLLLWLNGIEWNVIKWNNHFIIIFDIVRNEIDISFYFFVWYNKIKKEKNEEKNKKINYNNILKTNDNKIPSKNNFKKVSHISVHK